MLTNEEEMALLKEDIANLKDRLDAHRAFVSMVGEVLSGGIQDNTQTKLELLLFGIDLMEKEAYS